LNNLETTIFFINLFIIGFAYLWLYPRVARSDIKKISLYDTIASLTSLALTAYFFMGTNLIFNLFGFELDWFGVWFFCYALIETPFMLWYFKKYDVWKNLS